MSGVISLASKSRTCNLVSWLILCHFAWRHQPFKKPWRATLLCDSCSINSPSTSNKRVGLINIQWHHRQAGLYHQLPKLRIKYFIICWIKKALAISLFIARRLFLSCFLRHTFFFSSKVYRSGLVRAAFETENRGDLYFWVCSALGWSHQ